jgi:hypothetical protein
MSECANCGTSVSVQDGYEFDDEIDLCWACQDIRIAELEQQLKEAKRPICSDEEMKASVLMHSQESNRLRNQVDELEQQLSHYTNASDILIMPPESTDNEKFLLQRNHAQAWKIRELEQQNAKLRERWEKLKAIVSLKQNLRAPSTIRVLDLMKEIEEAL